MKKIFYIMLGVIVLSSINFGKSLVFPDFTTNGKVGDFVLAPSITANKINTDAVVIYYSRTIIKTGQKNSSIKSSFDEFKMPNSLLIPIKKGVSVKKGDIVLTWWQSGSGMTRAYVTNATNPKEPYVKYLDGINKKPEKIKKNSFIKITKMLSSGSSVGIYDKGWNQYNHYKVINRIGKKIIVMGFGGKMNVFNISDCLPVPISPKVKKGDEVYVLEFSSFKKAIVGSIDYKNGQIKTKKGKTIAFCDVLNPVQAAQILLKKLGYNPGRIDGILGSETKAALNKFQKKNKLKVENNIGLDFVHLLHKKSI